jgi:predicted permease
MDTGFHAPERVLLASTDLFLAGYDSHTGRLAARELLQRVEGVAGVSSASWASIVPLGFAGNNDNSLQIDGYTPQKGENMSINNDGVGPRYFETVGTLLLEGREFTAQDDSGAPRVAIVNEAFAKKFWPGLDPLGRWIDFGGGHRTVVGVVATAKYQHLNEAPLPFVFLPLGQNYSASLTLHVRSTGEPARLAEPLRRTFAALDPNLPFLDVRTFAEHMGAAVYFMRIGAIMLGIFGVLALALSTMGIYSVIAYSVSRRTRELGIRTALGAARRDVLTLVLGEGLRLSGLGLAIGALLALGAAQLIRSQLLGVSAADPVTYLSIGALLASVALLATYLPARRAASVDPIVALRTE